MTLLIGLHGKKGCGKNTAADVIIEWGRARGLNVRARAFADLVKYSSVRALGIEVETVNDGVVIADSLKWNGDISIAIPGQSILRSISGREYLQFFGTEAHRDVFGKDFWVDQLLPLTETWQHRWMEGEGDWPDITVITDLRFANEADRIKQLGGDIWMIDRPGLDEDGHSSEQPLPGSLVDLVIRNDGMLAQFRASVNSWMTAEHHMKFVEKPDPLLIEDMCDVDDA